MFDFGETQKLITKKTLSYLQLQQLEKEKGIMLWS